MIAINTTNEPFFLIRTTSHDMIVTFEYDGLAGRIVRKIRGKKCRSLEGLMSEFGAALQFFDGFGENWNALKELLCDMDEWLPGSGYVIVITDPSELLQEEPEEFERFVRTIGHVGRRWSQPITDNGRFDRPARPFKVVLEMDARTAPIMKERIKRHGERAELI